MIKASSNGHIGLVELLLSRGADVDAKECVSVMSIASVVTKPFQNNRTALIWAAVNGHKDVVKLLVGRNANKSVIGKVGSCIICIKL